MKIRIFVNIIIFTTLATLGAAQAAIATVTEKDVMVITRIIGLLENGPKGNVVIATVKGDGSTRLDVDTFSSLAEKSREVGGIKLQPLSVNYEELSSTNAQVVFIPDGLSTERLTKIFEIAKRRKMVTISNSSQCLNSQQCAISITTSPAVDINLSVSAAAATGVSFGSNFRMIIKEVR